MIISDYPAPGLLANVEANIKGNVPLELRRQVSGQAHQWGALTDKFSATHGRRLTRILAADCLWISGEHLHLVQSMLHFLSYEPSARVWVVAGFHTGRSTVARFLDVALDAGLEIEEIWEQDVDGHQREWIQETESTNEGSIELRKWLVVAIFRRKKSLT